MDIARLNVLVQFEKSQIEIDEIGNHTITWLPYYNAHATVSGEDGAESLQAGIIADTADITFTIRYSKKANKITSTDYRIIFKGELYNILSVDHMNYRKKSIKIRAKKVRR